ncbi:MULTISPECIES: guanylate kinase [unclassified Paenibacillus]|uniref:guanylate kinase n=1 Tax=unclassified Paenibacillus TaxID=185978 RepID=UPI0015A057EE|nr:MULTISPECIES: guanylate kinase [unclassified Paenibacillus]
MTDLPILLLFTGTGGSGRKSVARLVGKALQFSAVVSYTTRQPRPKETNADFYRYISEQEFDRAEQAGEFIQTVRIASYRYGVKRAELEDATRSGAGAYLVLNPEGAQFFKRMLGAQAVTIFIYTGKQTILERLAAKNIPYDVLESYLAQYSEEVAYRKACEIVVENMELGATAAKVLDLVTARRLVS